MTLPKLVELHLYGYEAHTTRERLHMPHLRHLSTEMDVRIVRPSQPAHSFQLDSLYLRLSRFQNYTPSTDDPLIHFIKNQHALRKLCLTDVHPTHVPYLHTLFQTIIDSTLIPKIEIEVISEINFNELKSKLRLKQPHVPEYTCSSSIIADYIPTSRLFAAKGIMVQGEFSKREEQEQ